MTSGFAISNRLFRDKETALRLVSKERKIAINAWSYDGSWTLDDVESIVTKP